MTNWKYTKGSEKDFDGAPDWVNYRVEGGLLGYEYYVGEMVDGGDFVPCSYPLREPSKMTDLFENCSITAQRQPVTEWEGEGFPPVGVECEMLNKVNKRWYPVKICFIDGNNMAWIESNGGVIDCTGSAYLKEFRPIKSESERRRDETVKWLIAIMPDSELTKVVANYIYDGIAKGKCPHVKLED